MKLSELLSLCLTLVFVKRLKKAQRRLSKKFRKGKKQSNNYHKQRTKVAKLHLKVSRQRKDKAIKDALALVQSNIQQPLLINPAIGHSCTTEVNSH
ncbi:hypothetical protein MTo_02011 [Microcystis aeruginosa NIES-1211]|jgi:transposase|uniref:Probable transposase IS891/IS1136/IS1341 domain-containing protein n=1 Tax=Microcystis aeruginosa NIES-2519 TaxID=2303981 RepID=A0A5A5R3N1_MICAE|nr:hypothetical protein MTo_02011 [Microcystis aeruginosa NIES-1211]GCA69428.1 hypothetical protein MiYa_00954 [Microcystis aeruginosa NIES-2519]GCA86133.1 hypothetical protein MiHa_04121 [Microcystis aeruginosa NIES-2522]GCA88031.1 hypothetical protein MiTa_01372 [Microcystis aeruginosa NIES-4264]